MQTVLGIEVASLDSLPIENRARGFDSIAQAQSFTSIHLDDYLAAGEAAATDALAQGGLPTACSASGCEAAVISDIGSRLFRRPLEAEEVDRYLGLFASEVTEGNFEVGVRLMTTSMLASPEFLFRSEVGTPEGDIYRLTSWEIASALSYTLTGGPPDDRLRELAGTGALSDGTAIAEEARTAPRQ